MSGMGIDRSGNGNHWVPNNLATTDQTVDTPTNNFCTWNPLEPPAVNTQIHSEGNLKSTAQATSSGPGSSSMSTSGMPSGKWYAEFIMSVASSGGTSVGIVKSEWQLAQNSDDYFWRSSTGYGYDVGGQNNNNGGQSSYGASYTTGDVIGLSFDADNGTLVFYKNGVSQGTMVSGLSGTYSMAIYCYHSGSYTANFGQDATFAGYKSPSTVYDDGDYGSFFYQPPTGFKALCTQNLPDPTVKPGEHFNALTYSGDGSTSNAITGAGFQPDFVWIKRRDSSSSHHLGDVVRGPTKSLLTNGTGAENTSPSGKDLISFDADGFTVGEDWWSSVNDVVGQSQISWLWKAGGTAVSNTSGSITSQVSVNTDAGFSIIGYTGTLGVATVGHGLSKTPELLIIKNRINGSSNWITLHTLNSGSQGYLNGTQIFSTGGGGNIPYFFGNDSTYTAPTSTLFTIGNNSQVNDNGVTHIAYAFHSVDGFSKIGSYEGNGSTDGSFIYTGFQPKYVMWKNADGVNMWMIFDDARNTYNVMPNYLHAESSAAEASYPFVDFLSNGFKQRHTSGHANQSAQTYIYMAFAEFPFKFSTAR